MRGRIVSSHSVRNPDTVARFRATAVPASEAVADERNALGSLLLANPVHLLCTQAGSFSDQRRLNAGRLRTPYAHASRRREVRGDSAGRLGLLDDAMDGHYVGLTDVDPELGEDRHQSLAKRVEVLL